MSIHENLRSPAGRSRDEVEQILRLVPDTTTAESDALVALFSTAAGPVRPGELAGEAAAVAAFRAAQAPAAGRAKVRATLLTVKTAVAALAFTSLGGVALAATTGALPTPLTTGSPSSDRPAGSDRDSAPDTAAGDPTPAAVRAAAKAAAAADRAGHSARSASYAGLCTAFTAGAWDNARAAGNPAFSRLVAAAPDGNVAAFCSALADEAPAAKKPAPVKGKSAEARENAGETGKAAPRETVVDKGKVPAQPGTTENTGTTPAKGRDTAGDLKRGAGSPDAQRDQPSM